MILHTPIMKSSRKLLFLLPALIAGLTQLQAQQLKTGSGNGNRVVISSQDWDHIGVFCGTDEIQSVEVNTDAGLFTQFILQDGSFLEDQGKPALPVIRKLIEIPAGATVSVSLLSQRYTDIPLSTGKYHRVMPAQPPQAKNHTDTPPFIFDSLAYRQNAFSPSFPVEVGELGEMRGIRIARLSVMPVSYNPALGILRVYDSLRFLIEFHNADPELSLTRQFLTSGPYFSILKNALFNTLPAGAPLDTVVAYPVKYVIVSPVTFQSMLQPFIAWKRKKGFTVIEAYTNNPAVGYTAASIKSYLQNLYNAGTPSDPPPSFVLLVGDVAQIPTFSGSTGSHPTDLNYCEYTGDKLPELFYGRFSATNESQLLPQINKTLEYERYLMPDPAFLDHCVMIAGVDANYGPLHGNGQINYGTSTYFNTAHNLISHTYLYPGSGSQGSQIIQDVSNGCCFANYTAHGSSNGWANPSFTKTDIPGLNNTGKYPLMVGNACLTNKFNDAECFGEALLRASNKGAVGYIGASDNTYWNEDFYWAVGAKTVTVNPSYSATALGAYDRTFHDHGEAYSQWFMTQAQMIFAGNLAVSQSSSSMDDYYWEVYHLMGDPSLMIYYSQAETLTVSYNPAQPYTDNSLIVTTVPFAYVAVSYNGNLHGAAQANNTGLAIVPLSAFSGPGTADVVVTAQNKQAFSGTLQLTNPLTLNAAFTASTQVVSQGSGITFTDLSTGNPTSWNWSFPGGNPPVSSVQHPFVIYNTPGTWPVSLIVSNTSGSDTLTEQQYITVNPLASASLSLGTYTGCSGPFYIPLFINGLYDVASISLVISFDNAGLNYNGYSNLHPLFNGSSFLVNQNAGNIYISWISLTPVSLGSGTLLHLLFESNDTGNFPLTFNTGVPGNCYLTGLTGNEIPCGFLNGLADISGLTAPVSIVTSVLPGNQLCEGAQVVFHAYGTNTGTNPIYTWIRNGSIADYGPDYVEMNPADGDQVFCILTSSASCALNNPAVSEVITLTVFPNPVVNLGNDTVINAPGQVVLDAGPGFSSYLWSSGDTTQTITVTVTGDYAVTVTGSTGCCGTDQVHVTVIAYNYFSGNLHYGNAGMSPIGNTLVQLKAGNTIVSETLTATDGSFTFSGLAPGIYQINPVCTKAWGGVNATDALLIMKHFVQISLLNGLYLKAADVDATQVVNAVDALATQKRSVGIINAFPAGDWVFNKPVIAFDGQSLLDIPVAGLCYGDVNGSYQPPAAAGALPFVVEETLPATPEKLLIPVRAATEFTLGALSLQLHLEMDAGILAGLIPPADESGFIYHIQNNTLNINWFNLEGKTIHRGDPLFHLVVSNIKLPLDPSNVFSLSSSAEFADPGANILPYPGLVIPAYVPAGTEPCLQVLPNPFGKEVCILISSFDGAPDWFRICNLTGNTVYSKECHPDENAGEIRWNGKDSRGNDLPPGIYLLQVQMNNIIYSKKLVKTE